MPTTSANLGLTLPTPNVDTGWGGTLNTDFTIIDNLFTAAGSGTSVGLNVGTGKVINVGGTLVGGGTVILGSGDGTGTTAAPTIRGAARTGTNVAGPNLVIDAMNGTGTGGSGSIIFRTAAAGSSGTVANTMATAMEIKNDGTVNIGGQSINNVTPIGSVIPFAGSSAPTGWLLCFGQNVSRSTYANLFAVIGTTYGVGDNSTTFGLPDLRGRTVAGTDNMGGTSANRLTGNYVVNISTVVRATNVVTVTCSASHGLTVGNSVVVSGVTDVTFNGTFTVASVTSATVFTYAQTATNASSSGGTITISISDGIDGDILGAVGGSQTTVLQTGQIPAHFHVDGYTNGSSTGLGRYGSTIASAQGDMDFSGSGTASPNTSTVGADGPHGNLQPTIVLNYIIKH